jgi:heme a synthase
MEPRLAISATEQSATTVQEQDRLRPVRIWLYAIAGLVLAMVVLGGATRLTQSGLSITSWRPISGIVPPLSLAEWQAEFDAYRQIPQFEALHSWMQLEDFKYIFWWEWAHRALGRVIGLAFAIPFIVFLVQRRFNWQLAAPLAGLFVLGGFQGFLGWWMVSSGLSELIWVSQYRLAAHLTAAALLLVALVWVARRLTPRTGQGERTVVWPIVLLLVVLIVQIAAGAFVAGLKAGYGFNTWPLMNGALVPAGLDALQPLWRNLFENPMTVQFVHRMLAYLILVQILFMWIAKGWHGGFSGAHAWLPRIGFLVLLQVGLGIATLLAVVPLSLALGHQVLAFMLAGAVTAYLADSVAPVR